MSKVRQTCTDHCTACGQHFHGLKAFEYHQQGGQCNSPGLVVAKRGKREGQPLLQLWTATGSCNKELGCWVNGKILKWIEPVTIWQVYAEPSGRFWELRHLKSEPVSAKST